ncbi:MAG: MFS transporter [Janthinobacterium lividum]
MAAAPAGAPDRRARLGLDLLNFFVANLQTAFGPFVSVYLTTQAWTQGQIGLALSIGTVASMASQIPAGALVDRLPGKRGAAAVAILGVIGGALLLAAWPARLPVAAAEVLHGFASCVLGPAIAAISLAAAEAGGIAAGERFGRNARWASIGNGVAAGLMGACGFWISARAVFVLAALLAVPGLLALRMIRPPAAPSSGPAIAPGPVAAPQLPVRALLTDRRLLAFSACVALFGLSNGAMLPLAASQATAAIGARAQLVIAACIVLPQLLVALLSPAVGRLAERHGRRGLLLLGFAALPVRGVLLSLQLGPYPLVAIEALDGIGAASLGVLLPLIAADITRGTGRFNLCMGFLGLWTAGAATLSTALGGLIADRASVGTAFLALAGAGAAGTLLVWAVMPETRRP